MPQSTPILVNVTIEEGVGGNIFQFNPNPLLLPPGDYSIYYTLTPQSSEATLAVKSWTTGQPPALPSGVTPAAPGPFQFNVVNVSNALTSTETAEHFNFIMEAVIGGNTVESGDPEIVLQPPSTGP